MKRLILLALVLLLGACKISNEYVAIQALKAAMEKCEESTIRFVSDTSEPTHKFGMTCEERINDR